MRAQSLFFIVFAFFAIVFPAAADEPLTVSPDGPALVRLDDDAASVIVGNPAHASVALENPRLMMVSAGTPGMTRILVLGRQGNVIWDRPVIAGAAESGRTIRIRNACINGGDDCRPAALYYCPEGAACHTISVAAPAEGGATTAPQPQGGAQAGGGNDGFEE